LGNIVVLISAAMPSLNQIKDLPSKMLKYFDINFFVSIGWEGLHMSVTAYIVKLPNLVVLDMM
jgi:hypothetical protein